MGHLGSLGLHDNNDDDDESLMMLMLMLMVMMMMTMIMIVNVMLMPTMTVRKRMIFLLSTMWAWSRDQMVSLCAKALEAGLSSLLLKVFTLIAMTTSS